MNNMNQGLLADHYVQLAKEDLKELADLDSAIKHLHDKLQEKQARVYNVSASATDDVRVQTTKQRSKLENSILEIEELKEKLLDAVLKQNAVEREKREILHEMPWKLQSVIDLCINGGDFRKLGISPREKQSVIREALTMYGQLLSEKTE